MSVFQTVASAVAAASAAGTLDVSRQSVYATTAAARAAQATAPGMPPVKEVYASELLDTATCTACAAIDGKNYGSVEQAHGDYNTHGGYMGCLGGLRCRGTLVIVYGSETPAGGDDGILPYTPTKITPQPNPPPWSPPTLQPTPPPPPGFTGVQINDVYGDKVLVAVRQDGSYVWPQRSSGGKWVGSDGHPLPDDVVRWLDSHPVSKDWKPNWKVNTDPAPPPREARVLDTPKIPDEVERYKVKDGKAHVETDGGGLKVFSRRPDGTWQAGTKGKKVPDDWQKWLDHEANLQPPKPAGIDRLAAFDPDDSLAVIKGTDGKSRLIQKLDDEDDWVWADDGDPLPDDVMAWLRFEMDAKTNPWKTPIKPPPAPTQPVTVPDAPGPGVKPWDPQARTTRSQRTSAGTNDTGSPVGGDLVTTNDMTLQHVSDRYGLQYDDAQAIRAVWSQGHAVLRPFQSFTSTNNRAALLRSRGAVKAMDEAPLLGVDRVWRGMRVTSESMWDDFRAMQPGDVLDTKGAASFTTSLGSPTTSLGRGGGSSWTTRTLAVSHWKASPSSGVSMRSWFVGCATN